MPCDGGMDLDCYKRSSAPAGGGGGCGEEHDYLSSLPDHLLLHILLRLPVAAAARTSTLSRCWRELFADVHGEGKRVGYASIATAYTQDTCE